MLEDFPTLWSEKTEWQWWKLLKGYKFVVFHETTLTWRQGENPFEGSKCYVKNVGHSILLSSNLHVGSFFRWFTKFRFCVLLQFLPWTFNFPPSGLGFRSFPVAACASFFLPTVSSLSSSPVSLSFLIWNQSLGTINLQNEFAYVWLI